MIVLTLARAGDGASVAGAAETFRYLLDTLNLEVLLECLGPLYTVQCARCSVLPPEDEDLAVETG